MSVRIVVNTESLDQISSAMDKVLLDLHANSKILEKAYTDLHTHSEGQYFMRVDSYFVTINGTGNQLVDILYNKSEFVKNAKTAFVHADTALKENVEEVNKRWINDILAFKYDSKIPVVPSWWDRIKVYPRTFLPWITQVINGKSSESYALELQIDEAAKQMKALYEQYNGNWGSMSEDQRLLVLQNIENQMALLQGREAVPVGPTSDLNEGVAGAFVPELGVIAINSQELSKSNFKDILSTILHEGRHAFQKDAYYNENNRDDFANSNLWGYNMTNYTAYDPENPFSLPMYLLNPTEQDARDYSQDILKQMGL